MFSVKEEWASFREGVLGPDAPQAQIDTMELAFYAGVSITMGMMHRVGDSDMSESDGVLVCKAIANESEQFFKKYDKDKT